MAQIYFLLATPSACEKVQARIVLISLYSNTLQRQIYPERPFLQEQLLETSPTQSDTHEYLVKFKDPERPCDGELRSVREWMHNHAIQNWNVVRIFPTKGVLVVALITSASRALMLVDARFELDKSFAVFSKSTRQNTAFPR